MFRTSSRVVAVFHQVFQIIFFSIITKNDLLNVPVTSNLLIINYKSRLLSPEIMYEINLCEYKGELKKNLKIKINTHTHTCRFVVRSESSQFLVMSLFIF